MQELRHSKTCLVAVRAKEELFTDSAMIGKLPSDVQTKWYDHRVTLPHTSAIEERNIFEHWLNRLGDAATMQRLTILATELSRGTAASAPPPSATGTQKKMCGRCQ